MKAIFSNIIIAFLLVLPSLAFAQQEAHNTQFMYYKLGYNPGFAGAREAPCITAIYRNQWLGIEGAPQMQVLTFNMPLLNQRVGVGVNLSRQSVGITELITFDGIYSYRFPLWRGYLGIGIQGSIRSLSIDFQDERLHGTQPLEIDPAVPDLSQRRFLFNFGTGMYYQGEKFYLGLSAPRLLPNNIDFAESQQTLSREVQHVYLMGGVSIQAGENVRFQPQTLVKFVPNAPIDADVNLSAIFTERYIAGLTYRLGGSSTGFGESVDILLAAQISKMLFLGFSYDITLSELRDFNTGSMEVLLRVCFGKAEGEDIVNPRFF
ncbi:MAG: type IX secretion system membrane protein PorP/SprF [Saprospirales bacterium]|jgi:type IX secretion system PorP/SprF family membrane protein|nr:type IX secretion system membrane protein PorP/SprF [Saprospirales bacterium]MBK7336120.1 type IX secretion system membrane protein PorP/SprF [Saprospirales bacterium]